MPATTGMKGGGFYDQHSAPQAAAIALVQKWMEEAAATIPLTPAPRPIAIADFGSSEGRNAIAAMRIVTEMVRQRSAAPIQTVYCDLPSNNFNRLFANLADSADKFPAEVYPSAVPGSFYRPLLPPNTVALAMCFNAILWMDRLPSVPVKDFISYRRPEPPRPGLTIPSEPIAAFTRQAADDLIHFYQARAREMVPGGKLVVATPGDAPHWRCCDGLYDVLNDACLDFVAAGRVERQRYEQLTLPVYFRTQAELLAPLTETGSPVRGSFVVDHAETAEVSTPIEMEFQRTGDAAVRATATAGFLRAFSEPVVRSALCKPGEDAGILDALYQRVAERIHAEPERYRFRYIQVSALLTRSGVAAQR